MDMDPGIRIHPAHNTTDAWMEIKGSAGTGTYRHRTTRGAQAPHYTSLSLPLFLSEESDRDRETHLEIFAQGLFRL